MAVSPRDLVLITEARTRSRSGEATRIREIARLSQREVADAIGVTPPTISRWESGSRRPRGKAAIRFARLLNDLSERQRQREAAEHADMSYGRDLVVRRLGRFEPPRLA